MKLTVTFNVDEENMEYFKELYERTYSKEVLKTSRYKCISESEWEKAFAKGFEIYAQSTLESYIEDGEAIDYVVKNAHNYYF